MTYLSGRRVLSKRHPIRRFRRGDLVSSSSPTRPGCAVIRLSMLAAWERSRDRNPIICAESAIDGAKNFGRFEAFFLPTAQWEQVRDAFWARTGFPVDPGVAVERLKGRLSDAFDRFLEGVADNRQVAFDDDGWRLKTDPAEPPDPAQSDRLAELHRWLDARNRTIRLADLLIEVENDLGFSVHFQQPGERVDPGEVCALLAAILAHGCNLGLYTMEKVAPDIAYRRLKYVATGASSRRTSAPRSPLSSMASPARSLCDAGSTSRYAVREVFCLRVFKGASITDGPPAPGS